MNRSELEARLNATPVSTVPEDSKAHEDILALYEHPGFYHLYGLLLGARQGQLMMLAQVPLGNAAQVTHAAVIQGTIRGIELFYQTALEHAVPDRVTEQKEQ